MEKNKALEISQILKKKNFSYNSIHTINDKKKYKSLNYFCPPDIINLFVTIGKNKNFDFINFVIPSNDNIAYLSSIFIAMEIMRDNYKNILNNYIQILKPGTNVELCANGKDTGKIYRFMGESKRFKNLTRIETIPFNNYRKASIEKVVKNIFQFVPTEKKINRKNIGKCDWKDPELSSLDKILGTRTFNNPVLIKNEVIFLSEKKKLENFFKTQYLNFITLDKIISNSFINENGKTDSEHEPLFLYTNKLNNIYEYFKNNKNNKIIISDSISKFSDVTLLNQILQLNNSKFMFFSNEKDFDQIKNLYDKKKHQIWKFEKSEINEWHSLDIEKIDNVPKDIMYQAFKSDYATRTKIIFQNYSDQNISFRTFHEDAFDKLTKNLKKISSIKSENTVEINENLINIYFLKHKLQDYIFGIGEDELNYYNNVKEKLKTFFNYNKKYFSNEEFDCLNEILKIIGEIDISNPNFLKTRRDELRETLAADDGIHNKINTTIISDNPKIKSYYKKNIKEKWDLDMEVNTTQSPRRVFKYAIVPSELNKQRISKIINEHKYKNIIFFSTPSIKTKVKEVRAMDKSKWKKFYLEPEEKVKICNIEKDQEKLFYYSEHINYTTDILKGIDEKADLDTLFYKPFDLSKLKKESSNPDDTEARVIIFYGDAFGYFTENTEFKVINNLINNSKRTLMQTVNFKTLKIDDYLLIRDSSDRDVVEAEAKLYLKSENDYHSMRSQSKKWYEILKTCFDNNQYPNLNINNLYDKMYELGFNKSKYTLKNLKNNLVICPDDEEDLKILIDSLEIITNTKLISAIDLRNVYKSAQKIKVLHRTAGMRMAKKIIKALSEQDVDIDREPVRVDYNKDGTISLNSSESEKPEAWIVQIQEIKKEKYKVAPSEINKVQF
jgi:hypothetical protein